MIQKIFKLFLAAVVGLSGASLVLAQDKADLVNKLIGLTVESHPFLIVQGSAERKANTANIQAREKQNYTNLLTLALKQNNQLTAEQKAFVSRNLGKLVDRTAFEVLAIRNRNINAERWLRETLRQHYSNKLSAAELTELNAYFAKDQGKLTLSYIASSPNRWKNGKANYTPEEMSEYNDFVVKTPLGSKFFNIFMIDTEADVNPKLLAANKQIQIEIKNLSKPASLNEIINQFANDNLEPGKTNKTGAVNQLVGTTINWQKEVNKGLMSMPAELNEEDAKIQSKEFSVMFDEALEVNKSLTPDQIAFVKANYSKLSEILLTKQKALVTNLLPFDDWMKKGLTIGFTNYLTIDEINNINTFLQSPAAKNLGKDVMTETQFINSEFTKFFESAAGSKFFTVLKKDVLKSSEPEIKVAYQKYMEANFKLLDSPEINKIINEFVAANYKK